MTLSAVITHASHPVPPGAPTAVVHIPAGLDPTSPLRLVVFLHGFSGCAAVLVGDGPVPCRPGAGPRDGWGLGARHDEAAVGSVLVVPQLVWLDRDGSPGRFAEAGFARAFLEELVAGPVAERLGVPLTLANVASVTLLAHSAGFETALAWLQHGGLDDLVRHVVLFDALYAGAPVFLEWAGAEADRRLVSLYTARGSTYRQSMELVRRGRGDLGPGAVALAPEDLAAAVRDHRLVVAEAQGPHGLVPARYMATLLRALLPGS